jgi:hypothetical protein
MTSGALNTGLFEQEFNGEYDIFPSAFIRQSDPLPFTMLGLVKELDTEEE